MRSGSWRRKRNSVDARRRRGYVGILNKFKMSKAEETRARSLNAALDLFRRQGFDRATMRGIAAEAGVSLGSAYDYFAPIRAFLGALFRHAAGPQDPLSPFSRETRHIRERDRQYFAQALEGG